MPTITAHAQSSSARWHALRLTRQTVTEISEHGDSTYSRSTARLPAGLSRTESARNLPQPLQ